LILDCQLKRGNPPDQIQVHPLLKRHYGLYGRYPRQTSFDGGFATSENLRWVKQQGILDVAFAKKHKLTPEGMVRSSWIYQQLRRFRALAIIYTGDPILLVSKSMHRDLKIAVSGWELARSQLRGCFKQSPTDSDVDLTLWVLGCGTIITKEEDKLSYVMSTLHNVVRRTSA
jgi:hypothetical protein